MPRRSYSPDEKADALQALNLFGGDVTATGYSGFGYGNLGVGHPTNRIDTSLAGLSAENRRLCQ